MGSLLPVIICFGDSLTAGFRSPSLEDPVPVDTPYGTFLQKRLAGRAIVRISGICGELTRDMRRRFSMDILRQKPVCAVILGGTNDLGCGVECPEIFANLRQMYEAARASGIEPVALTVPSIRGFDAYIDGRHELNALLFDYCARHAVPCVDLFAATAEPGTGRLAEQYSNDGLHLTVEGYRLIAELLCKRAFDRMLGPA